MLVKCNKCEHIADESKFPKGRDFFQNCYIASCPECNNRQSPGDASMRGLGGKRPFEYVREANTSDDPSMRALHRASEAS